MLASDLVQNGYECINLLVHWLAPSSSERRCGTGSDGIGRVVGKGRRGENGKILQEVDSQSEMSHQEFLQKVLRKGAMDHSCLRFLFWSKRYFSPLPLLV